MLRIFCGRIVDARWLSDKTVECIHNLLNLWLYFLFWEGRLTWKSRGMQLNGADS
jgi:hypothetical protein